MTKSWLKDNNVSFVEKNVSEDGVAEELIELGYKVTPVLTYGDKVIVGYSPDKLAEAFSN